MKTLEDLRQRCVVDGQDGCWLFKPTRAYVNAPVMNGVPRSMQPRRAAWLLAGGRPLASGYRVFGLCGTPGCVNPEHLRALTPAEHGRRVTSAQTYKGNARRVLAVRAGGRQRASLTPEMIREIAASPETGLRLAARFGVSDTTISKARRGQYACYAAAANPWAGLMG